MATKKTAAPQPPAPKAPPAAPPTPAAEPQAEAPEAAAPAPMLKGTFSDLTKCGGEGWGIKVEEDGDIGPGTMVECRRKDGTAKVCTVKEVIFSDYWKVCATIEEDPNDLPPNARKGKAIKTQGGSADLGDGDGDDPRPTRQGNVRWSGPAIDLGGTFIREGLVNIEALYDL